MAIFIKQIPRNAMFVKITIPNGDHQRPVYIFKYVVYMNRLRIY